MKEIRHPVLYFKEFKEPFTHFWLLYSGHYLSSQYMSFNVCQIMYLYVVLWHINTPSFNILYGPPMPSLGRAIALVQYLPFNFPMAKKKFIIFCCFKVSWSGCCGSVFLWYKPCDMHYFIQPKTSIYIYQVKSCQTLPVNVQLCLWKDNRLVCIMCCHALYMTNCSLCKFVCSHWCFAFVFNLSRRNIKALEIVIHDVHCDI